MPLAVEGALNLIRCREVNLDQDLAEVGPLAAGGRLPLQCEGALELVMREDGVGDDVTRLDSNH